MENQQFVFNQIINKDPTELYYTERTVFRKNVNTNFNWKFELSKSEESTPSFVIVGFQARNKMDSQTHNNATFDLLPVSNAVCKIGSKQIPMTKLNVIMIETNMIKVIMKLKTSIS